MSGTLGASRSTMRRAAFCVLPIALSITLALGITVLIVLTASILVERLG